ncbi:DUF4097 family beta strand repeat-containing protein [Kitasatospora sp. NPDC094015]|uniref:DUF4097 family beta strand repeat-containing protein n=1 Tax=Kitasatospora sp. NPDC094015 TaxID=3155205 RepID=UPI003326EDAB
MQTFDTPAPIAAVLDLPAGRVRFVAAERPDTVVEIRPANPSTGRDVKLAEQIAVAYGDGVLRITAPATNRLGNPGAVEVTVHLPAGSRVEAKAGAAELSTAGQLGEITAACAQGSIEVERAAAAHLTTLAGDVTVGRLDGPAEISTQQGAIRIAEAVRGALVLRTRAGDIAVGAAAGSSAVLDAGTGHGRIHNAFRNAGGDVVLTVHATTAHGDITARSL